MRKKITARCLVLSAIVTLLLMPPFFNGGYENASEQRIPVLETSLTHAPIEIYNNSDLIAFPDKTGSGMPGDPYVIENLVIAPMSASDCIRIWSTTLYITVRNCTLSSYATSQLTGAGINLMSAANINVTGNRASNNLNYGISAYDSRNITIAFNNVTRCDQVGIAIHGENITVTGNKMEGCGLSVLGSLLYLWSYTIDGTNTVNGKNCYYYVNKTNLGIANFTNAGQITLVNCNDSSVTGLAIGNASFAIHLLHANNVNVTNNVLSDNSFDIYASAGTNLTIARNDITKSRNCGIRLDGSNNSTIDGNNVTARYLAIEVLGWNNTIKTNHMNGSGLRLSGSDYTWLTSIVPLTNTVNGKPLYFYRDQPDLGDADFIDAGQIYLVNCSNSVVNNLTIMNGSYGVEIAGSSYVTITNCTFMNLLMAIELYQAFVTTITDNTISGGQYPITISDSSGGTITRNVLQDCLIAGWQLYDCTSITIYYNSFRSNKTCQIIGSNYDGITWDNGTRGNYWSNYEARYPTATNNGIVWNTPYAIPGSTSKDRYPLVQDWTNAQTPQFPWWIVYVIIILVAVGIAVTMVVINKKKKARKSPGDKGS
nr:NosD domain-containing protein [Candidatus Sigynarchaeota archaeon]